MSAEYTVHVGHGLADGRIVARQPTRQAAQAEAVRLIREDPKVELVEVRRRWYLLDQYVRRGNSPRHIVDVRERHTSVVGEVLF